MGFWRGLGGEVGEGDDSLAGLPGRAWGLIEQNNEKWRKGSAKIGSLEACVVCGGEALVTV